MDLDQNPWRVVGQFFDELRIHFNRLLDHLEPWQIVLYTLSAVLITQWLRKVLKFEETSALRNWVNNIRFGIGT